MSIRKLWPLCFEIGKKFCKTTFCTKHNTIKVTTASFWMKFVLHTGIKGIACSIREVLLLHDNVRPHTTVDTRKKLQYILWATTQQPYSVQTCHLLTFIWWITERVSWRKESNLKLTKKLKHLSNWLAIRPRSFYTIRIENLQKRWKKCIAMRVITLKSNNNLFIFLFEEIHFYIASRS